MKYRITPFGEAILRYCVQQMGVLSPEMQALMEQLAREQAQSSGGQLS